MACGARILFFSRDLGLRRADPILFARESISGAQGPPTPSCHATASCDDTKKKLENHEKLWSALVAASVLGKRGG